jgi:isocitrate lyase
MRAMIESGAAGVHFEDQLASEKKCGHLGGKVLVPIQQHIRTLNAARLAADVEGVPTVLLCRTDSHSAQLLTADVDERDQPFITGERTAEGFFRIRPGIGVMNGRPARHPGNKPAAPSRKNRATHVLRLASVADRHPDQADEPSSIG